MNWGLLMVDRDGVRFLRLWFDRFSEIAKPRLLVTELYSAIGEQWTLLYSLQQSRLDHFVRVEGLREVPIEQIGYPEREGTSYYQASQGSLT